MKRFIDLSLSFLALLIISPIFIFLIFIIWIQDFKNPIYSAPRIGKNSKKFIMYKLRSMNINASLSGVESTSTDDKRITKIGKIIRKFKLDEISQLINVFLGSMSLVGPRPNTPKGIENYTKLEQELLSVKPGITDFASIIFSDEGEILKNSENPDLDYDKLIRPRKSILGIFYLKNYSLIIDFYLCIITLISIFSKKIALKLIERILKTLNADEEIIKIASRTEKLRPMSPPK
ncbi:MAG: sugar transferase [Gammaproteobacteria bacterium]